MKNTPIVDIRLRKQTKENIFGVIEKSCEWGMSRRLVVLSYEWKNEYVKNDKT